MKIVLATLIGLLLNIYASTGFADSIVGVTISQLHINRNLPAKVFIRLNAPMTKAAACSTDTNWHYVLPLANATDDKLYALLLSAQIAGKVVDFWGTGQCPDFSTIETMYAASVK